MPEIKPCTLQDAAQLAEMNKQLIEDEGSDNPMTIPELEKHMQGFLENRYRAYFLMVGGTVASYALVNHAADPLYLRQFFIGREHRRQHLGTAALNALIRHLGTDTLDLEVLSGNERGRQFWESCGFQERSRYMRLHMNSKSQAQQGGQ